MSMTTLVKHDLFKWFRPKSTLTRTITVRELVKGYKNNEGENGVIGFNGKLHIRPPYQREFVYEAKDEEEVIYSVRKNLPLGLMNWADCGNGEFEIIDGQQRTLALCRFINHDFSIVSESGETLYFDNLPKDEQEQILNYELMIFVFSGTSSEKLEWFKTINIVGKSLTDQELHNAAYTGPWLTDAKKHFSKTGCAAYNLGSNYVTGSPIRQEYLETVLDWISNGNITDYMAKHQHDKDANELWLYFQSVIKWIKTTFIEYDKRMNQVNNWGNLYNLYKDGVPDPTATDPKAPKIPLDPLKIKDEINKLVDDDEVTNKKGIYEYVLTRNERKLNIRVFDDKMKQKAFNMQAGVCPKCKKTFKIEEMQGDHIIPWSRGGKTIPDNLQMLCKRCNGTKSGV